MSKALRLGALFLAAVALGRGGEAEGDGERGGNCLLVDTDMDLDDAMALAYSCTADARDLRAVTVSGTGFTDVREGVSFAARLLQLCGDAADRVPVRGGLAQPLAGTPYHFPREWQAAARAFYRSSLPEAAGGGAAEASAGAGAGGGLSEAAELILETARACRSEGRKLDIVALAPLTNLAEAITADAELFSACVGDIFLSGSNINATMGNDADCGGTVDTAECNIFLDARAADIVLRHAPSVHVVDAVSSMFLPAPRALAGVLQPTNEAGSFFHGALRTFLGTSDHPLYFYDPAAAVWRRALAARRHTDGGGGGGGGAIASGAHFDGFCHLHRFVPVKVDLQDDMDFGTLLQRAAGAPSDFCWQPDTESFMRSLLGAFFERESVQAAVFVVVAAIVDPDKEPKAALRSTPPGEPRPAGGGAPALAFLVAAALLVLWRRGAAAAGGGGPAKRGAAEGGRESLPLLASAASRWDAIVRAAEQRRRRSERGGGGAGDREEGLREEGRG